MATKRRPLHLNSQPKLNFRPNVSENVKCETKGTKPLPEPSSIAKVILMMILQLCRKIMFVNTKLKVTVYLSSLFVISFLADQLPFPRTYLSQKDNIFNVYFVKVAWGWTLALSFPFVVLTSSTYCCGKRDRIIKHLTRLLIATVSWYFWVNLFSSIESVFGACNVKGDKFSYKSECLKNKLYWQGFDISGHAFILIYSSLVIIEESRAIIGWEGIEDLLRNEEHTRSSKIKDISSPLRNLNTADFEILKMNYKNYSPIIRTIFIAMTLIVILWDLMLLSTILYFHSMVEKFISGCIAISMWLITYKYLFTLQQTYLPDSPGDGLFKYKDSRLGREVPLLRKNKSNEKNQIPKFMGMPLNLPKTEFSQEKCNKLANDNGVGFFNQT